MIGTGEKMSRPPGGLCDVGYADSIPGAAAMGY